MFEVFDLDLLSVENFIHPISSQAETKHFIEPTLDYWTLTYTLLDLTEIKLEGTECIQAGYML